LSLLQLIKTISIEPWAIAITCDFGLMGKGVSRKSWSLSITIPRKITAISASVQENTLINYYFKFTNEKSNIRIGGEELQNF